MSASIALAVFMFLVVGTAAGTLVLSHFLGRRRMTPEKDVPYECGMLPIEQPATILPVRFYKMALLFVVFDVEIVFLYLWAVVVRDLGVFGLAGMFVFIALLLVALAYAWRRGDFNWE